MYHFLARIGRKKWAERVMPVVSLITATGYLVPHHFAHPLVRKLYTAHDGQGKKEEICPELKQTIMETYDDIKELLNLPVVEGLQRYVSSWKPTIKWFATSSLQPQVFGSIETYTGILVGLPYYYNYDNVGQLPSQAFQFKSLSFFKSLSQDTDEPKEKSEKFQKSFYLAPTTEAGKAYLESLILSEKAKKFSIARELFYADSYRVVLKACLLFTSTLMPVVLSRQIVSKMNLKNYHITYRFCFYLLAGMVGLAYYNFADDTTTRYYDQKADSRALEISQSYREGGIEYFEKQIQRHKALRSLSDDFKSVYDKDGNFKNMGFRDSYIPLTERLEMAIGEKPSNSDTNQTLENNH